MFNGCNKLHIERFKHVHHWNHPGSSGAGLFPDPKRNNILNVNVPIAKQYANKQSSYLPYLY